MRTVRMIDLETARSVVDAAVARAASDGGKPVAVAVVDREGTLVALSRMDGAGSMPVSVAINKAYTSARLGRPTAALADQVREENMQLAVFGDPRITAFRGGVPISDADGDIVGAVGISGRAQADDAELSEEAVRVVGR